MKAAILRGRIWTRNEMANKYDKDGYETAKSLYFLPRKFTKASLHEILAELILETSASEKNDEDTSEDEADSEFTLLSN